MQVEIEKRNDAWGRARTGQRRRGVQGSFKRSPNVGKESCNLIHNTLKCGFRFPPGSSGDHYPVVVWEQSIPANPQPHARTHAFARSVKAEKEEEETVETPHYLQLEDLFSGGTMRTWGFSSNQSQRLGGVWRLRFTTFLHGPLSLSPRSQCVPHRLWGGAGGRSKL